MRARIAAAFSRAGATVRHRALVAAVVVALCALSVFQMLQYWHGVMPMADTTWPQYRSAFLRGWW